MKVKTIFITSSILTLILALIAFSLAQTNNLRLKLNEVEDIKQQLEEVKKQQEKYMSMSPIDKALAKHFSTEDARIAKAILTHESRLNPNAKNYNCYYNNKSTFCKKGDEHLAWSVDCGIAQLNYHGSVCPSYTQSIDKSIEKMADMYEKRGWSPWVSFQSGAYKQYLAYK